MTDTPAPGKRCALITGASAGIGEAFARELAQRGHDLILVARRQDRLDALAQELASTHNIRALAFAADLADPRVPEQLFEAIAEQGLKVDILVNNAGYGVSGSFHHKPWEVHADFLQVLLISLCQLSHLALMGMRRRGYGRIINVASLAGVVPATASHTLYAASKSFVIRFSQSLALENPDSGVHVCAVCPGFTYSEFHDVTGTRDKVSQLPKWMWMDAATVARQGVDAVMAGRTTVINGRANTMISMMFKYLPDWAANALARRQGKRFRDTGD